MIKDTNWDAVYPGAKVHEETIYVGKWRGRNYDKYHSYHRGICLTLVNGITIVMRPYAYDQSWSIQSIKYPTCFFRKGYKTNNTVSDMFFLYILKRKVLVLVLCSLGFVLLLLIPYHLQCPKWLLRD